MSDHPLVHELVRLPWRVGRSVGRTIYAQVDEEPSKADVLVGFMDSRELAARVVEAHNFLRHSEAGMRRAEAAHGGPLP